MNPTQKIRGRAASLRHMRDVRVSIFDEVESVDAHPVTLKATKTRANERVRVRCSIVEPGVDDVQAEGNSVGVRDFDMMVDDEDVMSDQRIEITFCRFDASLVGRLGTIATVGRDPTVPMRMISVRMDDNR